MARKHAREVPEAPSDLSESSRALWAGLVADLDATGGGAEVDLLLLGDVLRARDRLCDVSQALSADGLIVLGSTGQRRPHPLLATEGALRREVAASLERLGLSTNKRFWGTGISADRRLLAAQPLEALDD